MLKGKKILLGVTGSIAAYKAAFLVRLLVQHGAEVKVVMSELAKQFITPLTLATLSKNPVLVDFFDPENGNWHNHVDLGSWADVYLVAPATANTIAKMAHGIADNLLLTTFLSARCPVFVAPAMDLDMFQHPSTQENLKTLSKRGNYIIEPATGELASGLEGKGRMEEPEIILGTLDDYFKKSSGEKKKSILSLRGKKILITAGPTHENIDPVRFIANRSSGKMGYALADVANSMGAEVYLVSGPTALQTPRNISEFVPVKSSDEMLYACNRFFPLMDAAIFSAAVADYKPENISGSKMKIDKSNLTLKLIKTADIAQEMGKKKQGAQISIGFALETDNALDHAKEKLEKKNLDMIVLNSLKDEGAGFGYDTNKITIIERGNKIHKFGLKSKQEVAVDILKLLAEKFDKK
jgi:phosphopantothenoylcysteine decarboxylase/phosphopantothenate--cysteine ligase